MARTGKAPARASHTARRSARARVRGKTGRVSFPRAVPTADMRQNGIPHSDATVRKTLVFLQSAERPVPAGGARVDLARTFVGGFVSVPASAGAFPGSVSEGDISGGFLRLDGPRESTKRFSLRSCAGVNLETENALARSSDARWSASRPARLTHKCHSGAACVSECVRGDPKSDPRAPRASSRLRTEETHVDAGRECRDSEIVVDTGIGENTTAGRSTR